MNKCICTNTDTPHLYYVPCYTYETKNENVYGYDTNKLNKNGTIEDMAVATDATVADGGTRWFCIKLTCVLHQWNILSEGERERVSAKCVYGS